MEVILVQGPAVKLRQIADRLISCKGRPHRPAHAFEHDHSAAFTPRVIKK